MSCEPHYNKTIFLTAHCKPTIFAKSSQLIWWFQFFAVPLHSLNVDRRTGKSDSQVYIQESFIYKVNIVIVFFIVKFAHRDDALLILGIWRVIPFYSYWFNNLTLVFLCHCEVVVGNAGYCRWHQAGLRWTPDRAKRQRLILDSLRSSPEGQSTKNKVLTDMRSLHGLTLSRDDN